MSVVKYINYLFLSVKKLAVFTQTMYFIKGIITKSLFSRNCYIKENLAKKCIIVFGHYYADNV